MNDLFYLKKPNIAGVLTAQCSAHTPYMHAP